MGVTEDVGVAEGEVDEVGDTDGDELADGEDVGVIEGLGVLLGETDEEEERSSSQG